MLGSRNTNAGDTLPGVHGTLPPFLSFLSSSGRKPPPGVSRVLEEEAVSVTRAESDTDAVLEDAARSSVEALGDRGHVDDRIIEASFP